MSKSSRFQHSLISLWTAKRLATAILAAMPVAAFANQYVVSDNSIQDQAHGAAYTWGLSTSTLGSLEGAIQSGQVVTSATLTIKGLYDWTDEPDDVLYVNLLNNVKIGNSNYTYDSSPVTHDTSFGPDIFDTVTKPVAPVAPVKPVKPVKPTAPHALGSHPTQQQIAAYNAAEAAYQAALAVYNTANAAYPAALAAYNAAHAVYETDLTAYNTALTQYNNYVNTQHALGFAGVPQTPAPGSLYDQSDSLLVSNNPNGPGTWTDPNLGPGGVTTLTIDFSNANIDLLDSLLSSDSPGTDIGLGFGPDCHFYDSGITLTIDTAPPVTHQHNPVPDQGMTLGMLALGLAGLVGMGRLAKGRVGA